MPVLFLIIGFLLSSCGVSVSEAPRLNVVPMALRHFPPQNWRLVNNKFFLWKDNMTPADGSAALSLSKEIDRLDGAALPLIQQRLVLERKIDPLKKTVQRFTAVLRTAKRQFDEASKALALCGKTLSETGVRLADEKLKTPPNPDTLAQLTLQMATLTGRQETLAKQIADHDTMKESIERSLNEFKEALAPLEAELAQVSRSQAEIELAGQKQVERIMQVCDWYTDPPAAVSFQFDRSGAIQAEFTAWKMTDDEAPRSFSTVAAAPGEKPTIGPVTYEELGGVFTFDLYVYEDPSQTRLRETWHWRIARVNYDNPGGRNFFAGDIQRTRVAQNGIEVRTGMAKLIDRNN